MLKQKQPNNWSCLPTAFAIVLNKPISAFIIDIGHDGSEIIRPEEKEPNCRKGFHIQECIKLALAYEVGVIHLDIQPAIDDRYFYGNDSEYIDILMGYTNGVLLGKSFGKPHAVAWNCSQQLIIDPKIPESYNKAHFFIESFLMFRNLKSTEI